MESLFDKVAGIQPEALFEKGSDTGVFLVL